MIVDISLAAEDDIADGYWFYERQCPGLGDYFRSSIISDIDSLAYFGGIHSKEFGLHRSLAKRFPFGIYYALFGNRLVIAAVLDLRSEPSWIRAQLEDRK